MRGQLTRVGDVISRRLSYNPHPISKNKVAIFKSDQYRSMESEVKIYRTLKKWTQLPFARCLLCAKTCTRPAGSIHCHQSHNNLLSERENHPFKMKKKRLFKKLGQDHIVWSGGDKLKPNFTSLQNPHSFLHIPLAPRGVRLYNGQL